MKPKAGDVYVIDDLRSIERHQLHPEPLCMMPLDAGLAPRDRAVQMSIAIVRTFVRMRELMESRELRHSLKLVTSSFDRALSANPIASSVRAEDENCTS
jgi:hypothetical protein